MGNLVLVSLATLVAVGLTRSMSEGTVTDRFVAQQQAFYLAEGGLDQKLRQFLDADATNDTTAIGQTSMTGGMYQVAVAAVQGSANTWQFTSTGQSGATTRVLQLTVKKGGGVVPILGATTVVGLGNSGVNGVFYDKDNPAMSTMVVDGCDVDNPSVCLPGTALTSDNQYEGFVSDIQDQEKKYGYFGNRLIGAPSDYTGGLQPNHYSISFQPQDPNTGLTAAMLNSLAAYAKTQAQAGGCYYDYTNDDDSKSTKVGDDLNLSNKTLGTVASPKICFVDVAKNGGDPNVYFKGVNSGAGILVINGEAELPSSGGRFDYNGIVISLGPSGEFDFNGNSNIYGAMLVGSTQPNYETVDLEPRGTGRVQYSSKQVEMAQKLLAGWTSPSGGGSTSTSTTGSVTIQAWQYQ